MAFTVWALRMSGILRNLASKVGGWFFFAVVVVYFCFTW